MKKSFYYTTLSVFDWHVSVRVLGLILNRSLLQMQMLTIIDIGETLTFTGNELVTAMFRVFYNLDGLNDLFSKSNRCIPNDIIENF